MEQFNTFTSIIITPFHILGSDKNLGIVFGFKPTGLDSFFILYSSG